VLQPAVALHVAAEGKVAMAGKFEAGASFSAGAEAAAYLFMPGTDSSELSKTTASFTSKFYADWTIFPVVLTGFNTANGGIKSVVVPSIVLSVYDVIPIYVRAPTQPTLEIAVGNGVSTACTAVGGSYDASLEAQATVGIREVKLRAPPEVHVHA
jgi:hypothetical protein